MLCKIVFYLLLPYEAIGTGMKITSEVLKQNQKFLLVLLLIFLVGNIIGYFGCGHLHARWAEADLFLSLPAHRTALGFIVNNIKVTFIMMLSGILTCGAAAVFLLFINGLIMGESIGVALEKMPAGEVLFRVLPHGIFEVPAMLLAGVGGFIPLRIVIALLKERKIDYKGELLNAGQLVIAMILLLLVAGIVEAHITPVLADDPLLKGGLR